MLLPLEHTVKQLDLATDLANEHRKTETPVGWMVQRSPEWSVANVQTTRRQAHRAAKEGSTLGTKIWPGEVVGVS